VREILEEILPYMNIYRDEETTGLHSGWDIKGEDTGDIALTDVVNSEEDETPAEDELTDLPDTTGELTQVQEGAEESGQ
jgi:stage V sporulation protein D (sporulation-specific penicillin-binding protein)